MNSIYSTALRNAILMYTQMDNANMEGLELFKAKKYSKCEYFNVTHSICRNLAFVNKGMFRIFYTLPQKEEEVNLFFFTENQFMVSFKSFITQTPCYYTIQAMEDSEVLQISHEDLLRLYKSSLAWASFGRVLAEQYFNFSQERTESFLFKTAEQRYQDVLKLYPDIFERVPLYHLSSFLGIKGPSLSRIRKRLSLKK